jgi:beta-lactamase regulating signal transducer with metallopeptidase domain
MPDAEVVSIAVRLALNLALLGIPLAAGVVVALRLTRAGAPRVRYALAVAAFAAAAIVPVAATFSRSEPPPASILAASDVQNAASPALVDRVARAIEGSGLGVTLLAVWTLGGLALLSREAVAHVRLARGRRRWRTARADECARLDWCGGVPLLVAEHDGPCAVGIWRRAVVFPESLLAELAPEAARRVARHELAHARWHDPLANAALRAARAVIWVSPALWLLERAVRIEREAAADCAALGGDGGEATAYAGVLVAVARWASRPPVGTHIGGTGLEERVARLLDRPAPAPRSRAALAGAALVAGLSAVALAPVVSPATHVRSPREARTVSIPAITLDVVGDAADTGDDVRAEVRRVVAREVDRAAVGAPLALPQLEASLVLLPGDGVDVALADAGGAPEPTALAGVAPPPPPPEPGAAVEPDDDVDIHVHRHVPDPGREVRRIVIRTRS